MHFAAAIKRPSDPGMDALLRAQAQWLTIQDNTTGAVRPKHKPARIRVANQKFAHFANFLNDTVRLRLQTSKARYQGTEGCGMLAHDPQLHALPFLPCSQACLDHIMHACVI